MTDEAAKQQRERACDSKMGHAVLAIAADLDLEIHQLDIKTAFLNGKLDEDVYIQQPPGYHNGNHVQACKLNKALYGLKQAS
jgi:hypothetical protein